MQALVEKFMNLGIKLMKLCNIKQETDLTTNDILQTLLKIIHCKDNICFLCLVGLCITVSVFDRLCFVALFCGLEE